MWSIRKLIIYLLRVEAVGRSTFVANSVALFHMQSKFLCLQVPAMFQGYSLAAQLGHSIVEPVPSLFTFKIDDTELTELSGVIVPLMH